MRNAELGMRNAGSNTKNHEDGFFRGPSCSTVVFPNSEFRIPNSVGLSVIGVGNPLMGDDGVGVRVIERLQADPAASADGRIEYLDGGVGGLRLLNWIEQANRLLFVDAACLVTTAGRCRLISLEQLLRHAESIEDPKSKIRNSLSLHQTDLVSVLRLASQFSRCPPTWLLAIRVESVERRDRLSPALEQALDRLAEIARRLARRLLGS